MAATVVTEGSGLGPKSRASSGSTSQGLPRWLWLFGVTVSPLRATEHDGTRGWIVCGGSGLALVTAVISETDQN